MNILTILTDMMVVLIVPEVDGGDVLEDSFGFRQRIGADFYLDRLQLHRKETWLRT